jgi:hypothetical protein
MTKPARDGNLRWLGFLLAAIVAVLVMFLGAGTASAATATAAQTRVGAHTLVAQVVVGPGGGIGAGQRLGNDLPAYDSALATGVAAKAGAGAADDWPVISGIVRDASRSKGNFGLGSGTASQANRAGQSWVGEGYRVASDGKTMVSGDGLRAFRPPSWKPDLSKYQANFEHWVNGQVTRRPLGNGHFDITDMGP